MGGHRYPSVFRGHFLLNKVNNPYVDGTKNLSIDPLL